jgi:CMP-N-acetylneuraminate monooxygenase
VVAEEEPVARLVRSELPEGISLIDDLIVVRERGEVAVARNRCRHQGGRFSVGDGCELVCGRHGWVLDACAQAYRDPAGGLGHPFFDTETQGDEIVVMSRGAARPWATPRERVALAPGELTVRFLSHASVLIDAGGATLVTDPWLLGPAFLRGWWLAWEPEPDALELAAGADAVFVSHSHPDHLNPPTLRALAALNDELQVVVPDFGNDRCEALVRACGLANVQVAPFDEWLPLGDDGAFAIFEDGSGRQDSGIVVDYKGHLLVNTVDCHNPASGELPTDVDVLMTAFAGGASGFPVCWSDLYSEDQIASMIRRARRAEVATVVELAKRTHPRVYAPIAGYFTEAHPQDAEIRERNRKNTPEAVAAAVCSASPTTMAWVPSEGAVIDVGRNEEARHPPRRPAQHDFATWDERIGADLGPVATLDGVRRYFEWAGYSGDLTLHVIETDPTFTAVVRELLVDFDGGPTLVTERPAREHRYLRMRVRSDAFRHVLVHGLSWEDLSIGFQARFYREPDRYNFDFWDHFQNALPTRTPW